jgi:antitoxin (DNA-binding transcriptional repressor) of toxin-antitoxin stability system
MTKTVNVNEDMSIKTVIALIQNGDEIVIEENGEPLAKVTSIKKPMEQKQRVAGLGKGEVLYMSEDFDDELPDDFWGFDKEL